MKHPWQTLTVILLVALVLFLALRAIAGKAILNTLGGDRLPAQPTLITYEVTGKPPTTGASLTYENVGGNTEQHDVSLPWKMNFTAETGQFLYVAAQLRQASGFEITCRITADGQVIETATSSGDYVIATCSGRAP